MSYEKDEDEQDGNSAGELPPGWRRHPDAGPKATPGPRYSPRRDYPRRPLLPPTGAPLRRRKPWRRWVPVAAVVLLAMVALGLLLRVVLPEGDGVADAPVTPDVPTDLDVGGSVMGEVVEEPVRLAVELTEDEAVRIDVHATDEGFDPFLSVFGPDRYLLAANDDAERGVLDSRLVLSPLVSGVYELEVRGWFVTRGSFTVSVTPA